MFVLKGVTNDVSSRLRSQYVPHQGELYVIFAHFDFGLYQAFETYRVLPLGAYFPINMLTGKTLDEQIQVVFKWRLDRLTVEFAEKTQEKKRLEEGIKK